MVNLNKNILRSLLIASYILIITLIIYGISAVFSYLNTGADRSTILHTEIEKVEQYTPEIHWSLLPNKGRSMDNANKNAIEKDYLDAWYIKQIAFRTNVKSGIADYYTESARQNLYSIIDYNSAEDITIESTTLSHEPQIELFSEDGQLVVITDRNVVEFKRIFKSQELVSEIKEISTYQVTLLLEDGFWRIRHLVKTESKPFEDDDYQPKEQPAKRISGINYYPKNTPWDMYGTSFDQTTISNDFKILNASGLNTIRIFVPYHDFGAANVSSEKIDKLKTVLDLASEFDLDVVITLFDFYGNYDIMDWTLNMKHAELIVTSIKDHPALAGWDIKNEPNLDFESRGQDRVMSWLKNMITHVNYLDGKHPVTIGWSDIDHAHLLSEELDMVTFHYYEDLDALDTKLDELEKIVVDRPIVMGEFGLSSYSGFWNPFGDSEEDQAAYHKKAQELIKKRNLNAMSWTLYDFTEIPKEVVGRLPWRKQIQKHFGFIDADGEPKASYKFITGGSD